MVKNDDEEEGKKQHRADDSQDDTCKWNAIMTSHGKRVWLIDLSNAKRDRSDPSNKRVA